MELQILRQLLSPFQVLQTTAWLLAIPCECGHRRPKEGEPETSKEMPKQIQKWDGKVLKVKNKNNQDRLFMTVTHTHLAESINFPTEIVTFEDGPTTIWTHLVMSNDQSPNMGIGGSIRRSTVNAKG